jgi:uncharacterized protein YndB with AHSA1/START domain
MKILIKIAAYGVGALILLVVVMVAVGAMVPVEHVASVEARYEEPPEEVWQAVADYRSYADWRSGVDRVEEHTFEDGDRGWVELGADGPLPLAIVESSPPRRLVVRIATDALPFGGTWTYELEPDNGGTRVRITENGTVSNLLFRFMARFVFGYTATMEAYLVDLGAKFGEQTVPRTVAS